MAISAATFAGRQNNIDGFGATGVYKFAFATGNAEVLQPNAGGGVIAYAGGTTYAAGDFSVFNGKAYVSLQAGNIGHQPDVSPTWWAAFSAVALNLRNFQQAHLFYEMQAAITPAGGKFLAYLENPVTGWIARAPTLDLAVTPALWSEAILLPLAALPPGSTRIIYVPSGLGAGAVNVYLTTIASPNLLAK